MVSYRHNTKKKKLMNKINITKIILREAFRKREMSIMGAVEELSRLNC
jgi:hypothetical protein